MILSFCLYDRDVIIERSFLAFLIFKQKFRIKKLFVFLKCLH